jgi:UDP-glucuronate 4-epimerase
MPNFNEIFIILNIMAKILITGTAGFIGFHLANQLIHKGWDIIGLDTINDYYDPELKYSRLKYAGINKDDIAYNQVVKSNKYNNYSFIRLDLEDRDAIESLFENEKFDHVCHLAAQAGVRYSIENPYAYIDSNIYGFMNIIEGSRHHKVKHFTYASSSSVYGINEEMPLSTHKSVSHPISLYAASKRANELIAHSYAHLYHLPSTGLRFFTVYGPWGRPDMALFLFTKAIIEGKPIKLFNNGDMVRDFTYVDDIVEGVDRVINSIPEGDEEWSGINPDPANSKFPYKVYNIGNSSPIKLTEFVDAIENKLGKKAIKEYLPMQKGDVYKTFSDVSDLEKELNYKPQTSVEDGISNFIDWYLEYYQIKL